MRHFFPKAARLLKRRQFKRMAYHSKRHVGSFILIDFCANSLNHLRLGITVSKRFGKSHERNRFKRIAREAFRLCYKEQGIGYDLNIKPRSAAKEAKSIDLLKDYQAFIKDIQARNNLAG